MIDASLVDTFVTLARSDREADVVGANLIIARIEYPSLDPAATLAVLDDMGQHAADRIAALPPMTSIREQIEALNTCLFDDAGFTGNDEQYDDPRNSFLNEVVGRRTGIPISLSVIYMEIARRAGIRLEGVNFPGHFLVRHPSRPDTLLADEELLIDPFHRGSIVTETDCQRLLAQHLGDDAPYSRDLLARADKSQILFRMLTNLKRLYIRFRSFPHARAVVDLMVALDPSAGGELRDRGYIAVQMHDDLDGLHDLEKYLRTIAPFSQAGDDAQRKEYEQVWEHVKILKRRLASLN